MAILLNKGQCRILEACKKWFRKQDKQVFKITGYAGTGKSTIVFKLIEELGLDSKTEVLFVTYVGKATLALRKNGLLAKTIHSAFYYREEEYVMAPDGLPILLPNGRYKKKGTFKLKKEIDPNIKLIVIDEAGMVPKNMSDDLKSFNLPIIALGDPGQLLPIFGKSDLLIKPDGFLTEVVRQKEDDPILLLATMARNQQDIPLGKYGSRCYVVDDTILRRPEIYTKPSMVLCGKNKTRENINRIVREQIKHFDTDMPQFGDKLVCRKNNWDIEIDDIALINGLFGYITNIYDYSFNGSSINIDFMPECLPDKWYEDISLNYEYLNMEYSERKEYNTMYSKSNVFEYGYASTVHLAQGSEYPYVMMIEEPMGDASFQSKMLYTGITRASNTLILVRPKLKAKSFFF